MKKNIPTYYASVDEEGTGMFVVSLVDEPAVEVEWQLFSTVQEMFKIENEDRKIITGVVMLAETPIYRMDQGMGEYYIKYSKDTIEKMVQKYFKGGYQENVDENHSFELIDGIELQQAFIKDTEKGIAPVGFEKVPDGSLFFTYKVTSDELWDKVKNGSWTGFSLAGAFSLVEMGAIENDITDEEFDELMGYIDQLNKMLK
jgi:hypothetical protein